jgi:3-methyladenine DNA glycosylase AlkD
VNSGAGAIFARPLLGAKMDSFEVFRAAADPAKAAPMSAYMRDQFPFAGISTPDRRKLSREFLRAAATRPVDWDFVFECWRQPEREFQYLAKDYLAKLKGSLSPDDIPNLRQLVTTKSWWDTVDGLDTTVGDIAWRFPEVNRTLLGWSLETNIWLRRIAIDHQLGRKERTNTGLLAQIIINNLGQTEFFINKAIGWSLRDYSKTSPAWVRGFVSQHRPQMAALSVREASKYI